MPSEISRHAFPSRPPSSSFGKLNSSFDRFCFSAVVTSAADRFINIQLWSSDADCTWGLLSFHTCAETLRTREHVVVYIWQSACLPLSDVTVVVAAITSWLQCCCWSKRSTALKTRAASSRHLHVICPLALLGLCMCLCVCVCVCVCVCACVCVCVCVVVRGVAASTEIQAHSAH